MSTKQTDDKTDLSKEPEEGVGGGGANLKWHKYTIFSLFSYQKFDKKTFLMSI